MNNDRTEGKVWRSKPPAPPVVDSGEMPRPEKDPKRLFILLHKTQNSIYPYPFYADPTLLPKEIGKEYFQTEDLQTNDLLSLAKLVGVFLFHQSEGDTLMLTGPLDAARLHIGKSTDQNGVSDTDK